MKEPDKIKLVECPRDAMQGIANFIPTEVKIRYINALLRVGYDTLDVASFVSATAIPQLRDSAEVLEKIAWQESATKLLAIIANVRGAKQALTFNQLAYLGFPLSLSETFQQKNTNKSIAEAFQVVQEIQQLCTEASKTLVVYLSMGFGNPYGDLYAPGYVEDFIGRLQDMGVKIICPSDTVGIATTDAVESLFGNIIPQFPGIEFGAHLHGTPDNALLKINAAYKAGCRRFDSAIKGYGGCPMAEDVLVGNIATESVLDYFTSIGIPTGINMENFNQALQAAGKVF